MSAALRQDVEQRTAALNRANASRDALHAAVCQAVALLNVAPEVVRCGEGREARDILRQALADYADAFMDQPVTAAEREAVARKHRA